MKKQKLKSFIKLKLQFLYHVLFAKSNFKLSLVKRMSLAFSGGYTVDQYHLYNFEVNDKSEYLSEQDWFKSRLLNKPYDEIINDKLIFNDIVKKYANTPRIFAAKRNGILTVNSTEAIDEYGILKIISDNGRAILKPISKGKGIGIYRFDIKSTGEIFINNSKSDENTLFGILRDKDNWILSDVIEQHGYAARIYPGALNTIRIVVIRDPNCGKPVIAYAVHRFGTSQTGVVDNASGGGIISKIDIETGRLSEARSLKNLNVYYKHPDTGTAIDGCIIPQWDKIKTDVLNLSKELFYLKLIAWDIALTEDGIYIVEGNSSSGVNIIQLWEGQRNKLFGNYLRSYGVIK